MCVAIKSAESANNIQPIACTVPEKDGQNKPERPQYEVAEILRQHGEEYRNNNSLTDQQSKAIFDIVNCRTSTFGYHVDECENCSHLEVSYNSCGNRHCPKCQGNKRFKWIQDRLDDLLPVPYYHVVFTIPNQIFPLAIYNQEIIYNLLFEASAATLKQFASNSKWWNIPKDISQEKVIDVILGFFGVLHTWGQTLSFHPHIHYVVPGGCLHSSGKWLFPSYQSSFLFPVKAMALVFRGKFIEGLKEAYYSGKLELPGDLNRFAVVDEFEAWIDELVDRDWVTYSKPPFAGPEQVIEYVSRYTHRVAISNHRILSSENNEICFSYKDYKDDGKQKEMTLSADEFIRRFLHHILPAKFHRIRHYGYLANGNSKAKEAALQAALVEENLNGQKNMEVTSNFRTNKIGRTCPNCDSEKFATFFIVDGFGRVIFGEEEWQGKYNFLLQNTT
ncbi:MAG: IS91 family transposase [Bacteroidota bacterium]|nr:IS91 family transposase [Bacteroidota bacterium]